MAGNVFTAPLRAVFPYAKWTMRPPAGPAEVVYQTGAGTSPVVAQVVPFLEAACAAVADPNAILTDLKLPVPGAGQPAGPRPRRRGRGIEPVPPADPLARLFWDFWPEVWTAGDAELDRDLKRLLAHKYMRPAYEWEVWYGLPDGPEASFRAFDLDGTVVPVYDLDRRPLADLRQALTTPDQVAELFKLF